MSQEKLKKDIEKYMLESGVGFLTITASTDITKSKVVCNFHEELEDDLQDIRNFC